MNRKAIQLWDKQDHEGALREFRQAATPRGDAVAWVDYGNALILSWQGLRAVEAFEKARRIGPARTVDRAAADRLLAMRRYDLALPFLERVRAAGNGDPRHAAGLATALDRAAKPDEAAAVLEEAIDRIGAVPELLVLRAKLLRRLDPASALAVLDRMLADDPGLTDWQSSTAQYERAASLEQLGRWSEVFPTLRMAKAPLLAGHDNLLWQSCRSLELLDQQVRSLTADQVRSWREAPGPPVRPLGLIAGFPRSGTTLLEVMLGSHERVAVSSEAAIFSDFIINPACDPRDGSFPAPFRPPQSNRLARRYWQFHEGNVGELKGRLLLDKNPAITPLLHHFISLFPAGRVLFCLREPKDVLLSCFMRELPMNQVSVQFLDWRQGWHFYRTCMELWLRLRDLLDGGFLEVRYERLVADPEPVMRQALALLDLPWSPRLPGYLEHGNSGGVFSPSYAEVRKPIHAAAVGRWERYADQFGTKDGVPVEDPLYRLLGY
jgi:hypothetical protein